MNKILIIISVLALSGCGNSDKAALITKIIDSCEAGNTVSVKGRVTPWVSSVEATCTWVKKQDNDAGK